MTARCVQTDRASASCPARRNHAARRRRRADAAARADRRPRPCHGPRLLRASARPRRHEFARRSAAAASSLCRGQSERPWIIGLGWNQELWPDKRFPDRRRPRCGRHRPASVLDRVDGHAAVANSAAMKAAGFTLNTGAAGRTDRKRPVRRCCDESGGASQSPAAARRITMPRWPRRRTDARQRPHCRRDMGTAADDWAAMKPRRAGRAAQCPAHGLCRRIRRCAR